MLQRKNLSTFIRFWPLKNLLVFMELCPESLLESSNLLTTFEFDEELLEFELDCMDDRAEDDLAELSAKTELEDDIADPWSSVRSLTDVM